MRRRQPRHRRWQWERRRQPWHRRWRWRWERRRQRGRHRALLPRRSVNHGRRWPHCGGAERWLCQVAAAPARPGPGRAALIGRFAILNTARDLHQRFGISDPKLMRALATLTDGVALVSVDQAHAFTLPFSLKAMSRKKAVRGARLPASIAADAFIPIFVSRRLDLQDVRELRR